MGNTCCQDDNIKKDIAEEVDTKITAKNYTSEFYQTEIPQDQHIIDAINDIRQDETFALVLDTHKVMKHKYLDKYYVGKWSAEGEPEGLGVMFEPDNYVYHGEFHVIPNGSGTLQLLKEGLAYTGQMRQGRADGKGVLRSRDGKITFEGDMLNSFPRTGQLRITNLTDPAKSYVVTLKDFPESPCKIVYGDGRIYEGQVSKRSFAPLGKGTAHFPDGSYYDGEWDEGEMHGHGYFHWKDGTSYNGEYQHGRKHGIGTFTYLSRKQYQGEWAAGKQNGRGKLLDANGNTLREGVWREGVLERSE